MRSFVVNFISVLLLVSCGGNVVAVSPDLSMYGLKGNVKSCKQGYWELEFDEQGKWLISSDYKDVLRDEEGRICVIRFDKFGDDEWAYDDWTYDSIGRVEVYMSYNWAGTFKTSYVYKDGQVCRESYDSAGEQNISLVTEYCDYKFDEQGNWIERKAVIVDYPNLSWDVKQYAGEPERIETRTITYY